MISFRAIVTTSLTMGLGFTCLAANAELRAASRLATSPSVWAAAVPAAQGQSGDPKALLQEKLNSQFKLTKLTADNTDIVTAGSVLVLQKDGLLMFSIDTKVPPTSTYKDGKLSMGFGTTLPRILRWRQLHIGANCSNFRNVSLWQGKNSGSSGFDVQDDGVIFQFYSDPYQDVRYYGKLKFPFRKHSMPPADEDVEDHRGSHDGAARRQRRRKCAAAGAYAGSPSPAGDGADPATTSTARRAAAGAQDH